MGIFQNIERTKLQNVMYMPKMISLGIASLSHVLYSHLCNKGV